MFEDEMEIENEEPRVLAAMADTAEWQAAIEKVVRNVVSIRFCQTCSFDTDPALTSEATGFVVDAERGWVAQSDTSR
jgi:pro-apoptotic serine protease NMA111